jgi:hypothetical protein
MATQKQSWNGGWRPTSMNNEKLTGRQGGSSWDWLGLVDPTDAGVVALDGGTTLPTSVGMFKQKADGWSQHEGGSAHHSRRHLERATDYV